MVLPVCGGESPENAGGEERAAVGVLLDHQIVADFSIEAPAFAVPRVLQPERHDVILQFGLDARAEGGQIHRRDIG